MNIATRPNRLFFARLLAILCLCALFPALAGCSGRASTTAIRSGISSGNTGSLEAELEKTHESYGEMVTALNLARIYQINERWGESIKTFEEALALLEEYENRAIVNMRGIGASVGTILFSRGAESYFGAGYERSLLHTLNSLNYAMLGDFSGAAIEIRRMAQRQELWLEESQARIEKNLENRKNTSPDDSLDDLPGGYSMRELLQHESVRQLLNNYQDPFSYSLGAVFYRLAGDLAAANVSMRRATALDRNAQHLFAQAWGAGKSNLNPNGSPLEGAAKKLAVPPLPPEKTYGAVPGVSPDTSPGTLSSKSPGKNTPSRGKNTESGTQEVTIIALTGLAPALGIENVRVWFPTIGYILIDLPTYTPAVRGAPPEARASLAKVVFYPLLQTDLLAYRTLLDEVRMELATAISRATFRAGVATASYAAASSNKDTHAYASLASTLTTALMDFLATSMSGSVRNWETLPNTGYMAMTAVPRGSIITIKTGRNEKLIHLPPDARGVIIMVNELSNTNLKVNHVTY